MKQYELIEFFGVLPKEDEEDCYDSYRVEKNNLILDIAFFYSTGFSLLIFHKESDAPVFSLSFDRDIKIERLKGKNDYDCLNIIVPFLKRFGEGDWNHTYTVRIFIEPNIKVEILN
jgi:hypothetical protein